MADPKTDFDFYAGAYYNAAKTKAAQALEHRTPLPFFECYVLRLVWALEFDHVKQPDEPLGDVTRAFLLKLIQECRAFTGAMREGSVFGTFHHARTLIEVAAQAFYLFGDSAKTPKRMEKWSSYQAAFRYAHRRALEIALASGKISQAEFDERCLVPPRDMQVEDATLARWRKLWKLPSGEIVDIPNWHHPAAYTGLLSEMERAERYRCASPKSYAQYCHATHLSPLSRGFVGAWRLIAFDYRPVGHALIDAFQATETALGLLPEIGPALLHIAAEERQQFQLHMVPYAEAVQKAGM